MHPTAHTIPATTPAADRRPSRARGLRRAVLLLLAVLTIASGVAIAPRPASALTPGTPRVLGPIGWEGAALVAWSVPDPGDEPVTSYKIERYLGDAAQPQKVLIRPAGTMWLVDSGLQNATTYRYRVQAFNGDGASGWSAKEAVQPKAGRTSLAPFADAADYVERQYQDLLGRQPSPAELQHDVAGLVHTPVDQFTDELAHRPARVAERHPVLRLYFAFFERSPDRSGATYWINKRKGGTNLHTIASSFAGSSEFKTTYGNLSNGQFVTQVYLNVFDRQPDPAGLSYWTKKLDAKQLSRGQVMVGFSESNEYAGSNGTPGKSTARVETADLFLAVMKAAPSVAALTTYYAPHVAGGGTQGSLAMLLMPTQGYPKF